MEAGGVPQHPPTIPAPSAGYVATTVAKCSGVSA